MSPLYYCAQGAGPRRRSRFTLALGLCLGLAWLSRPGAAAPAMAPGSADWSRRPFSDCASHGVLRREPGLLAWRLDSARAFGSLAASPNGAKLLFEMAAHLDLAGAGPCFVSGPVQSADGPLWAVSDAQDAGLKADAVTQFVATDGVLAVLNLRNAGGRALRLNLDLSLRRNGQGLSGTAACSARYPALWLSLDRSQAVGRDLVDEAGVWLGGGPLKAEFDGLPLPAGQTRSLGPRGLAADLAWARPMVLVPGASARIPILLVWGDGMSEVQARAERLWRTAALPPGLAYAAARKRWSEVLQHLPPSASREPLLKRAVGELLLSDYGRRADLAADAFSAQKGRQDAFFSVDSPLAALGWSELDFAKAEAAVLDLASFASDGPAAVPPYTGDEKLAWDAAGMPLNALAAWELYQRDPDSERAGRFITAYGPRLRHECAWWPPNRGGAGDGLYAYALDEELPDYLRADGLGSGTLGLHGWSLGLSSLVAWQMQLGAVLAQAAGAQDEANGLLANARLSVAALHAQAWDLTQGATVQGMDGLWPIFLGLESDPVRVRQQLQAWISKLGPKQFWPESGAWEPWRVYFLARTFAEYGYLAESSKISENFLDEMTSLNGFPGKIGQDGTFDSGDSVASAAAVLELLLKREQQALFLTEETGEFEAPFIQFRSLDGNFYLKRIKIQRKTGIYSSIRVETPHHGKIIQEGAFILSCPESMTLQIQSAQGMDISRAATPNRLIFEDAHRVEFVAPARQRFLVRFVSFSKSKQGQS